MFCRLVGTSFRCNREGYFGCTINLYQCSSSRYFTILILAKRRSENLRLQTTSFQPDTETIPLPAGSSFVPTKKYVGAPYCNPYSMREALHSTILVISSGKSKGEKETKSIVMLSLVTIHPIH